MIIYRLRRHFFPSPFSLTLLWGGLAYIIVTSICTVFTAVSTADLQALPLVLVVSAILPFAILTAVLGMFIEKNPGPRSSLWLITTCAISMASFILMVFPTPGQSIRQSIILSILCCGPFLLVSALLAAFFITRAYPQFEASLFLDRAQRMRDILLARSEITLNNLSAELEMPLNSLPEFVDKLVKSGFVSACYSPETNYIYTLASLLEKQRRLTAIIQVRGRQTVGDLARDLHVPTSFIRKWLTNMAEKGLFIGYINPKTNEIISSQINSLAETPNCPNCGGLLTVVGKGVNQCA